MLRGRDRRGEGESDEVCAERRYECRQEAEPMRREYGENRAFGRNPLEEELVEIKEHYRGNYIFHNHVVRGDAI